MNYRKISGSDSNIDPRGIYHSLALIHSFPTSTERRRPFPPSDNITYIPLTSVPRLLLFCFKYGTMIPTSSQVLRCGSTLLRAAARTTKKIPSVAPLAVTAAANHHPQQHLFSSSTVGYEWRQKQLQKLENKFTLPPKNGQQHQQQHPAQLVDKEEDLQQTWKEMESRVTRRRPRTAAENGGKTGRANIKKTEEEVWLQEGLYPEQNDKCDENDDASSKH